MNDALLIDGDHRLDADAGAERDGDAGPDATDASVPIAAADIVVRVSGGATLSYKKDVQADALRLVFLREPGASQSCEVFEAAQHTPTYSQLAALVSPTNDGCEVVLPAQQTGDVVVIRVGPGGRLPSGIRLYAGSSLLFATP